MSDENWLVQENDALRVLIKDLLKVKEEAEDFKVTPPEFKKSPAPN